MRVIKGITLSVVASILFGAMYYFTSTLTPLNGEQVYGWRTLLTLPFLTLFMALSGDWRKVGDTLARSANGRSACWACCSPRRCWGCSCGCSCGRRCTARRSTCRSAIFCCR